MELLFRITVAAGLVLAVLVALGFSRDADSWHGKLFEAAKGFAIGCVAAFVVHVIGVIFFAVFYFVLFGTGG